MNETDVNKKTGLQRVVAVGLVAASVIAMIVGLLTFFSRQFFLAELVNNFRFQIAIGMFALSVLVFYCGCRKWAIVQLIVGIAVIYPVVTAFIPAQQPVPGAEVFTLLSYNVLADNPDREPILDLISDHLADITIIIEFEDKWADAMKPFASSYFNSVTEPRWHGFGIALFSKHKLENTQVKSLSEGSSDNPFILTEVALGDQTIIVAACHLLAPMYPQWMEIRNQQIANASRLISEYQAGRDLPVVFAGDFNSVAWSPFISDMLEENRLRDSRQGYFYHGSYPTDNFLLRIPIDNVFVSDQVHIHRRALLDETSSDHYPLLVEFSISADDKPDDDD